MCFVGGYIRCSVVNKSKCNGAMPVQYAACNPSGWQAGTKGILPFACGSKSTAPRSWCVSSNSNLSSQRLGARPGRLDPSLHRCMAGMDYQHVHGSDDPHDDLRYRQRTLQCQALVNNRVAQALRPAGAPEAALGARAYLWLRTPSPSLGHSAARAALAAPHQRCFLDAGGGGCPCCSPS